MMTLPKKPIVRLTPVSFDLLDQIRVWRNENREFFDNTNIIEPAEQAAWFAALTANQAIYVVIADEKPVGMIGTEIGPDGSIELGHILIGDKTCARKGVMYKAMSIVLNWYDDNERRIWLSVKKTNQAAKALYEKCRLRVVSFDETNLVMQLEKRHMVRDGERPLGRSKDPTPKLARMYLPQSWAPHLHGLYLDVPYGDKQGYCYNGSFDGAAEVQACESLYAFVRAEAERVGEGFAMAETGTCDGYSTTFIGRALEDAGNGHIWTGEIALKRSTDEDRPWPAFWYEMGVGHRITPCLGDTRSESTWGDLPKELDVIFLDSDHTFTIVINEWELLGPRLKPGGAVMFHDTKIFQGVRQAVEGIADQLKSPINELDSCRGLSWIRKPEIT